MRDTRDGCKKVDDMNIKELRAGTGLSQAKFSEKYGIPERTIQDWEAEKRTPPDYVIDMLAYIIADENVNHTAWVFHECREDRCTGHYELFKDKDAAIKHAKDEWELMCTRDQRSYITDPAGMFFVAEMPVEWEDSFGCFEPDFSAFTPVWDAIAEARGKSEK